MSMRDHIDLLTGLAEGKPPILTKTQRNALLEVLFCVEVDLLSQGRLTTTEEDS